MLRLKNLSDKYNKRTLRGDYVHTQGTPYDVDVHPSLYNSDGSFRKPLAADTAGGTPTGLATGVTTPLSRSADAFVLKNGLVAGTVMVRTTLELVAVATGANTAEQPFGLLANHIGGNLDDIGDERKIGVWRGSDSVYTLLAPAFDDSGLASAYSSVTGAIPVGLFAGTDGRLKQGTIGNRVLIAHLIDRPAASRIVVDLKI